MNTILHKLMTKEAMITFLGFFSIFIGISFSSFVLLILLPFLLILIGILKLYELSEKH